MNEIQKAIQDARSAQANRVFNSFSNSQEVGEIDENIAKSQEDELEKGSENPFEKAASEAEEEVVEKSDIMGSLEYGNEIKISKTGKEIKDQIDSVILPELNASLLVKKNQADEKLKECGTCPSRDADRYWTNGMKIDCGYKVYPWDETYVPETSNRNMMSSLSAEDSKEKKGNIPESAEQAASRSSYNDIVREICNILVDIKACEILKTLKDETDYELTPRQVVTFRF